MGLYFCGIPPSNQLEKYYKMEVEEVWTPLPELEMKLFFFLVYFFSDSVHPSTVFMKYLFTN